ncbi:MAG: cytochrome c biogenesis protein CcsA, partial [Ilumatobacteraceae bacterium]
MTIDTPPISAAAQRRGTSTPATRVIGVLTIAMTIWLGVFGLVLSPADRDQGDAVRIMYVHVPSVWLAYLAFIVTAFASGVHLFGRRHSLQADRVAGASAEIGVVFMAVTLVTGMLWGRITWGVYWQWDARLTTTALLFISYIGYLAVRGLEGTREQRARRSAIVGLLAVLEVPLVHWSVKLWRSLHQEATVLGTDLDVSLDGLMLFSLFVGVVAFTLLFIWLLLHRSRMLTMIDLSAESGLNAALAQRRAEGGVS